MDFLSVIGFSSVNPQRDDSWSAAIPATMKRRAPRIWQMAAVAAGRALSGGTRSPRSIIVGTALGALDETKQFLDGVFSDGFGSPAHFIASVHNSMAGRIALELAIRGTNLTVCDGANSFASAVALCGLCGDGDFPVLVLAVDERLDLLDRLAPHLSPHCQKILETDPHEGCVAFVLDNPDGLPRPLIRSSGMRFIGESDPDASMQTHFLPHEPDSVRKVVLPSETGSSFLSMPMRVHDFISGGGGRALFGSYAPSSRSIAAVELCG
jgi:hypothetical protein